MNWFTKKRFSTLDRFIHQILLIRKEEVMPKRSLLKWLIMSLSCAKDLVLWITNVLIWEALGQIQSHLWMKQTGVVNWFTKNKFMKNTLKEELIKNSTKRSLVIIIIHSVKTDLWLNCFIDHKLSLNDSYPNQFLDQGISDVQKLRESYWFCKLIQLIH